MSRRAARFTQADIARAIRTVVKREAREARIEELIAESVRRIEALEGHFVPGRSQTTRPKPK